MDASLNGDDFITKAPWASYTLISINRPQTRCALRALCEPGTCILIYVNAGYAIRWADHSLLTKGVDMHENWPELAAAGLTPAIKELHAGAPDVIKGFSTIACAARNQ